MVAREQGQSSQPSTRSLSFAPTRWSLVLAASGQERASLEELCARYWYPVYAYGRRAGLAPESAESFTRHCFHEIFEHRIATLQAQRPVRFREWLLAELRRCMAQDWPPPCALAPSRLPQPPLPLTQYEERHLRESRDTIAPEQGFRRSFAIEVLHRAQERVRAEALEAGHQTMYGQLERFLTDEPTSVDYTELAQSLHTSPMVLRIAIGRLRERFRELVDAELAETITDQTELASERRALRELLADGSDPPPS